MDVSRLGPGQVILGVGAVVLIVSLFLDWISGVTVQLGATTISSSGTAFDVFSGMDIIMLIIGVFALLFAGSAAIEGTAVSPESAMVVAALGLIVFGWALGWDLENSQAGIGAWLALFASGAIAYGAYTSGTRSRRPAASGRARRPPARRPRAGSTSGPPGGSTPPPAS